MLEALNALLNDSGLSGGLSEKGCADVSEVKPASPKNSGETFVTYNESKQNTNKLRPVHIVSIAIFFAAIASALTANAQDTNESFSDSEKSAKLTEVVVTAQKREERLQDVPEAITVLDPQSLAENGQVRLIDYYSTVPGMSLYAGGNGTSYIALRGLSTGNGQNPVVSTVIDDVPAVASTAAAAGQSTSPDLDPSDLARIEVLKGPQGTLYGADSIGGLIKYVTVDPSTSGWSGRTEVSGVDIPSGGLGYAVRGAINIPVSEEFALRISGFDRLDPGYIKLATGQDLTTGQNNFNSSDVYGGRVSALFRPSDDFSVKLSALVQQTHGYDSFFDSTITGQSVHNELTLAALPGSTAYTTQYQLYSAHVDWKIDGLDIHSITGYLINTARNVLDFTGSLGTTLNQFATGTPEIVGAVQVTDSVVHQVSQELRIGSSLGHWLDWRLGGFYTHENTPTNYSDFYGTDYATGAPLFLSYTNQYLGQGLIEYAAFGDLTVHLTDRFDVEAGGRESWNKQKNQFLLEGAAVEFFTGNVPPIYSLPFHSNGSAFTYQVTPEFKISSDLMVYARLATGYRIGGYNQNAFIYPGYGVPESYAPDKTTNYEIGIKSELFEHALTFDAAAYHTAWSDIQSQVTRAFTLPGSGVTNYIFYTLNGGSAKSDGIELAIEAHPLKGLTISVQGSYQNAELTQDLPSGSAYGPSGSHLPYSTRLSGGLSVEQNVQLMDEWSGFIGGSLRYYDAMPQEFSADSSTPRIVFPPYAQLNVHMGARHDSWLMNLYLNNVTNRFGVVGIGGWYSRYSPEGLESTIIQPRTIGLSIAKTF